MRNRKHILTACLLCALLAFTALFGASAAVETKEPEGDNLTWKVENDTLTISGTGLMSNYKMAFTEADSEGRSYLKGSTAPWNGESFTKVVIEEGVTSIGDCAFYSNRAITSVTLPDTLLSIHPCAFTWCMNLTEINLPDSLLAIGGSAFTDCSALKEIRLPQGFRTISGDVFSGCTSLTDVYIPDSVTSIRENAFRNCSSLERIALPASVAEIADNAFSECAYLDSIIVERDSYAERYCLANSLPFSFADEQPEQAETGIGNSITWKVEDETLIISGTGKMENYQELYGSDGYIGTSAPWFGDRSYNKVIVEEGVTAIGSHAFDNRTRITSVSLPESLVSIGTSAFDGDGSLKEINIPDSVTIIGSNAFSNCSNLKSLRLPPFLKKIESGTFQSCKSLIELRIPDAVTEIGRFAFYHCTSLEKITLPASLTKISADAFDECTSLQTVLVAKGSYAEQFCIDSSLPYTALDELPEETETINTGKTALTWKVENKTLTISGSGMMENYDYAITETADGRQSITGTTAPWDKEKFTRVVVEEGILSLGNKAFFNHSEITDVVLPESLVYIEDYVFEDAGISGITIPGFVRQIGSSAFWHCIYLKEVSLPDSLTRISSRAFLDCVRLEHINIPASVREIGFEAFKGCGALKSVTVAEGSYAESYCIENKLPYDYGNGSPVHLPAGNPAITWKVENGTLTISGTGEMDDYMAVMAVHPSDNNYEYMGSSSPWYEEDYTRVVVEEGITSIGAYAFNNKRYMTSVTLPESLTSIGESAFSGCQRLAEFNLPDSVSRIGKNAFVICLSLKDFSIPSSMTEIAFGTFQGCYGITEITIPDSIVTIDDVAFSDCKNLETVTIPASVTQFGVRVFNKCENLKNIIVEKDSAAEQYCIDNGLPFTYAE